MSAPENTDDSLLGLNPADLLARGLATQKAATGNPSVWQPPMPEVLAKLLPQYEITALIGRGGMGAVYQGRQVALDRAVAIKLLPAELTADAEFVARFQREARMLAKLQHPGIVAVHDFGQTTEGHLYFVMEFIDGTDLHHIIRSTGLRPDQALEIIGQVCEALQYAHGRGVMHRDIKPANVLLTQEGRAKLADFGLARPVTEETGSLTRSNIVMGTPDYIAPEQMYGQADHRADLYSLGVMLYEMLTGQTPRGAWATPSQRVQVDVRLDQVVIRALQQDPAMRYQQASEMKTDVDLVRFTPLPAAKPPGPQAPKPRAAAPAKPATAAPVPHRKSSSLVPIVLVAVLLLGGAGWWFMQQKLAPTAQKAAEAAERPIDTPTATPRATPAPAPTPAPTPAPATAAAVVPKAELPSPAPRAVVTSKGPDEIDRWISGDTAGLDIDAKLFGGHSYALFDLKLSVKKARQLATSLGGHLLTITSKEENDFIESAFMKHLPDKQEVMLGAGRDPTSRSWIWLNGEPFDFADWSNAGKAATNGDDILFHSYGNGNSDWWWVGSANQKPFIIEWDTDEPQITASKPTSTAQPATEVRSIASLAESCAQGGVIKTFGRHHENGDVLPGDLTKHQDFIQITANGNGWGALRKSGDFLSYAWAKGYPDGARPVNAIPVSFLSRSHNISFRDARDGSYRNIWGGSSQHRPDMAHAGSSRVLSVNNHLMALSASGEVLIAKHWSDSDLGKPPPDTFQGATSITASGGSYIVARAGRLVQAWEPHKQQRKDIATLPEEIAELDAGPDFVIIRTVSGKVLVRADQGGDASGKVSQVPTDLPPAIAVRAGEGMCAAQTADGVWTAWGESDELIEQTRKIGPALDVDYHVNSKTPGVRYMVWIEPRPGSAVSTPVPVTTDEVAQRLAQIAAQFQTAYDRDVAPGHNALVTDLDTKYLAAVNREQEAASAKGALEEVVMLRDEAQRVSSKQALPAEDASSLPESLKKLRSTYRTALAKLNQERQTKAKPYYDRYDLLLEAYQKELTQQKRLDDASKVKSVRDEVAKARQL